MAAPQRVFHGINGQEMRTVFLNEIRSMLHERLDKYWETPVRIDWFYTMALESYPAGERQPKASISGRAQGKGEDITKQILDAVKRHYDRDTDFGHHITFPKVTWNQTLEMKAFALPETVLPEPPAPAPPAPPGTIDLRTTAPRPAEPRLDPEFAVLKPATVDPRDAAIAELQRQINELRGGGSTPDRIAFDGKTPPRTGDLGLFAKTGFPNVPNRPQQDMTGGAEESPGAELAEPSGGGSALHTIIRPLETIEISVDHPSLDAGGAGNADAIRRSAELPLPNPRRVGGGHIVDFPLGEL